MFAVLSVVLPIFALVAAGALCRRLDVLGPTASRELNRFVVYLALPALLFHVMATASWHDLAQPGFAIAFGAGFVVSAALAAAITAWRRGSLADASLDGLNAGYANTAYLGIPLTVAVLGTESLPLVTISTILTVCILFAGSIVLIEIGLKRQGTAVTIARDVGLALVRNPLIVAPSLGVLYAALMPPLPEGVARGLTLLGGAASPCALVALGLFLAERSGPIAWRAVAPLVVLKLLVQPAMTWILAMLVFRLSPPVAAAAILLAAMPTGTGPFMLAELYRRDASITAATVLVSTLLGIVTLSGLILVLPGL